MDRDAQLAPLGVQRLRVLDCLGGNNRWAQGYFQPDAGADIFAEFRRYVTHMSAAWAAEANPLAVSLLAAARLLIGELAAAREIVEHLPAEPVPPDHGAGICLHVPAHALGTALPLPSSLTDTRRWLAGSPEQAALRTWLDEHAADLLWSEAGGVYKWASRGGAPQGQRHVRG